MDDATRAALLESIAHWERLATGKRLPGENITIHHCPLCLRFYYRKPGCGGCPVFAHTGRPYCRDTPHGTVADAFARMIGIAEDDIFASPEFLAAAQRELKFLRSLLPENES